MRVGAGREMVAKEEGPIVAQLVIVADPIAAHAGRSAHRLGLELRIDRFKNRRQRVIDRHEMRRLADFQLERDQDPIAHA